MLNPAQEKWDYRYRRAATDESAVIAVLKDNVHLLPKGGRALDYACGLGANACLLAGLGFETHAWDISTVAIEKLNTKVESKSFNIHTQCRDLELNPPEPASFDVIVVARYLDRDAIPGIINALKRDGIVFYQTFTKQNTGSKGPTNGRFLLDQGELLHLFKGLRVLAFRDEGCFGDLKRGLRNESSLVAAKDLI